MRSGKTSPRQQYEICYQKDKNEPSVWRTGEKLFGTREQDHKPSVSLVSSLSLPPSSPRTGKGGDISTWKNCNENEGKLESEGKPEDEVEPENEGKSDEKEKPEVEGKSE